ncbi:MAG: phosphate ABC transporter permease subunit PstC [Pseudomonadota bacterium]
MRLPTVLLILAALAVVAFYLGRQRSLAVNGGRPAGLHSLPSYYGYYAAMLTLLPALALMSIWLIVEGNVIANMAMQALPSTATFAEPEQRELFLNDVRNVVEGNLLAKEPGPALTAVSDRYSALTASSRWMLAVAAIGLAVFCTLASWRQIAPQFRARTRVEALVLVLLFIASAIAVLTTVGIVLSVLVETYYFLEKVSLTEFLFGLQWSPQTAIREDQVGASGAFGAVPLLVGTLLITFIAMIVAVPIGLMTAIYLAEYSSAQFRNVAKPLLEVLAGIPTVVYGFFAALSVAPFVRRVGESAGLTVSSESALAAGLVMGIMIIPLVSSLSDDAISAVPRAMRDGSLGLGATRSETMRQVIVPAALPGIVGGVLLAISRAIGETMIVVMAAGLSANLTVNPLDAVTTVTVQIVTLLQGDQEFDSAKTLAAFALGLLLFLLTLCLNVIGLRVVRKYREQYE